jgi:hypothetical protein
LHPIALRIPFIVAFSPHPGPGSFCSSGYPLRIEAGLAVELNTSVNGRSRKLTVNKGGGLRDSRSIRAMGG